MSRKKALIIGALLAFLLLIAGVVYLGYSIFAPLQEPKIVSITVENVPTATHPTEVCFSRSPIELQNAPEKIPNFVISYLADKGLEHSPISITGKPLETAQEVQIGHRWGFTFWYRGYGINHQKIAEVSGNTLEIKLVEISQVPGSGAKAIQERRTLLKTEQELPAIVRIVIQYEDGSSETHDLIINLC